MINIIRGFKSISYFLVMLILLQSCIAIYGKSSLDEAASPTYDDWRITIKTLNGEKHRLDWIDQRDGNIVSIHHTKRIFVDKEEVKQIVIFDPDPRVISIESINLYRGKASFLIENQRGRYRSEEFIQFENLDHVLKCYQMTSEDTLTVVIPIEDVEKIKVVNMDATVGVSLVAWLAVLTGLSALAASNMELHMDFTH